jgi:hypothetical protein
MLKTIVICILIIIVFKCLLDVFDEIDKML